MPTDVEEKVRMDSSMLYQTWYDFKKDFERQVGYGLLNWDWLKVKPEAPLPWNGSHMKTALSGLSRIKRAKGRTRVAGKKLGKAVSN